MFREFQFASFFRSFSSDGDEMKLCTQENRNKTESVLWRWQHDDDSAAASLQQRLGGESFVELRVTSGVLNCFHFSSEEQEEKREEEEEALNV